MLKNFVLETANAPGTSTTFNLGGAASGRLSFSGAGFTNGQVCFYVLDDGTQKEWGIGTFNTGSPNTMSRTTVVGNSAGTTVKLNFSGTTNVYNSLPAEYTAYRNGSGQLEIGTPGNITANSNVLFRGHLNGLITSRNVGTPNTKIDISVGAAMDEISQAGFITSASVLTIDAGTTGANGLDTGSLVLNAWYHIHIIGKTDGTSAGFMSTSLTPTLPSGYSLRRRLGSVKTDASVHFLKYAQVGDRFDLAVPVNEITGTVGVTTAFTKALGFVPTGVVVEAILSTVLQESTTASVFYISSLAQTDTAPATPTANNGAVAASGITAFSKRVMTDIAASIRCRCSTITQTVNLSTEGWIDSRGKAA